jgi:hypothetical protein
MPDLDFLNNRPERRKLDPVRASYEIRPIRFTTHDVTVILRCTRTYVHKLIKDGQLRAQGNRRKLWVSADSLQQYLASLPDWQP